MNPHSDRFSEEGFLRDTWTEADDLACRLSEEHVMQAAVLTSESSYYCSLFMLAPMPFVLTTGHGTIRECNEAAARELNVPARHIVGKPLQVYAAPGANALFLRLFRKLKEEPDSYAEAEIELKPRGKAAEMVDVRVVRADLDGNELFFWSWVSKPS
jgi:PAS domain-containing protein